MSLWDDAVNAVTGAYDDAQSAYDDLRNFLPGTIFVDGIPIPLKSTLDAAFGSPAMQRSVLEAYMIIFGGARQGSPALGTAVAKTAGLSITEGTAMGTLVIPDCFQVTIEALNGSVAVDNVLGVKNAGGTAAGAAAAVKAAWEVTGILSRISGVYHLTNYHAVDIGSLTGAIADLGSTTTGAASGQPGTAAACALIQWNGSSRSRSTRGRLYMGPITEGDINSDGRTLLSTTVTSLNTAFATFVSSLSSAGYPLQVLSRKTSTAYPVTSAAVEPLIATQRRRIRG